MSDIILNDLDPSDIYRNTPLIELGVYYRRPEAKVWQEMTPAYTLAKNKVTFNQLAPVWQSDIWKVTRPLTDWDEDRMDVIGTNGNDGLHY